MSDETFEYNVVNLDEEGYDWEDVDDSFLNGYGDEGWELCGIIRTGLIFKRKD